MIQADSEAYCAASQRMLAAAAGATLSADPETLEPRSASQPGPVPAGFVDLPPMLAKLTLLFECLAHFLRRCSQGAFHSSQYDGLKVAGMPASASGVLAHHLSPIDQQ